ncbi:MULTISPECIES: aminotransferase class IV [Hyphomonas]|uniref:Probable branched-chain-amino-acid aminotransferase n=2 Tax=Hyphomonas adhaerens TaxID=81029 RepID=A0A069E3R8_9PROT|nr:MULTISPECIES: aminotransferase class IV [Hyphomonas]KCZ84499.1 putative D-alanine aminotransferase [Hyphomonas adhaerens MHS-3]|tara:strand:+ start:2000 stop:2884 length:885 start_codon:yes stop_codon:yes gene_type:complete
MTIGRTVYLSGNFCPVEDATISPFDRGFLFAHAAYEVTSVYDGRFIDMEGHLSRLRRTLEGISIPNPYSDEQWAEIHSELVDKNGVEEGLVYLEVTGGAYGMRDFAGPETFSPTVFLYADARPLIGDLAREGIKAITLGDTRWKRRDMKTVQLLSQALAYRAAREAGAETAFMIEDGLVTEAASANAWIVDAEGRLITRELSHSILPGITRAGVASLLAASGLEMVERAFTPEEAASAKEVFTTSSGAIVAPVVALDGKPIGDGKPGPVTRRIQRLYYEAMGADVAAVAPWALG